MDGFWSKREIGKNLTTTTSLLLSYSSILYLPLSFHLFPFPSVRFLLHLIHTLVLFSFRSPHLLSFCHFSFLNIEDCFIHIHCFSLLEEKIFFLLSYSSLSLSLSLSELASCGGRRKNVSFMDVISHQFCPSFIRDYFSSHFPFILFSFSYFFLSHSYFFFLLTFILPFILFPLTAKVTRES